MSKRIRFIITAIILSLGFITINFLDNQLRFITIAVLTIATTILFYWSLYESIKLNATLLTLFLPTLFTLGVGLFWFLLPANMLVRIPVVLFYGVGVYALGLTSNIFSVSAIRTIALVRAARGVGFVLTLFTSFLLFDAILSLRADLPVNIFLIFALSVPILMQGLWASILAQTISKELFLYALILSLAVTQIAVMLYFWPVSVVVGSLFLTVTIYVLLGLGQSKLEGKLFLRTTREYLTVSSIVFIAMFLATQW